MPGNSFGDIFRMTTFGESHGKVMGVVIDGIPAGMKIEQNDLLPDLLLRRPGREFTSKRREKDVPEIISGTFNGRTTGAPVTITIGNEDIESSYYEKGKFFPRPGHSDLPAIMKYGFENWDYRGGGRLSARETVSRVVAGSIARRLLLVKGIRVAGCMSSIGETELEGITFENCLESRERQLRSPGRQQEQIAISVVRDVIRRGDSIGGAVTVLIDGTPPGLGEPVFNKLKADIAAAVMSIPGSTYFEMGDGIKLSNSRGSEVIDSLVSINGKYSWKRNLSGGIIGGISTGDMIFFRVGFKPTSSIPFVHKTIDIRNGKNVDIRIVGRHDPTVVPRAVAVVEAMASIVILDHIMKTGEIRKPLTDDDNRRIEEESSIYKVKGRSE